jgi:ferrochelatase
MARAILLVAHGSPDSPEQVPEYLANVTSGRALPAEAVAEIRHRYEHIGRSPLLEITRQQAELLRQRVSVPVYVGMRNWAPYIRDAATRMIADGVTRTAVICLAPHNSRTSVGLYKRAVEAAAADKLEIEFVESWHDHPLLIRAFAEKLRAALRILGAAQVPVIFTAHSVPERTIQEGDPYAAQARETAELVAAQVPQIREWRFAFQSQGVAGGAWIGPTVEETILGLKREGHRQVLLQPIGFLCDHVEVLYDIDIVFKQFAQEHGVELQRAESLNDSALLTDALADLAQRALATSPRAHAKAEKI